MIGGLIVTVLLVIAALAITLCVVAEGTNWVAGAWAACSLLIIFCMVLMVGFEWGHRIGQIDQASGTDTVTLVKQANGEVKWEPTTKPAN